MKIKITVSVNRDDLEHHEVEIDGKYKWSIAPLCECPEDAIIGRDLIDANDLLEAIQIGYDCAKRGDTLEIEEVDA